MSQFVKRVALVACVFSAPLAAQDTSAARVALDDRGLVFTAPARATEVALRFYVQPLVTLQTDDESGPVRNVGLTIRRARISLSGTALDPRLRFQLQFGVSRQDGASDSVGVFNALADALVTWNWTPRFYTGIGQAKIYGNRASLTSVSEIEFSERSIVNSTFALDRDAGVFTGYTLPFGNRPVLVRASVTSGEGRNAAVGDAGLAYTARVDWQPLGAFIGNGAFSESDLKREPSSRLAVGASFSKNEDATRIGGQTGQSLFATRDMQTTFVDAVFKRRGLAIAAEFARRTSRDPVTTSGLDSRAVFAGHGISVQASYVTSGSWLPSARVSRVTPEEAIYGAPGANERTQTAIGLSRYLRGHRLKWQSEFGRDETRDPQTDAVVRQLYARFGVVAGI